MDLCTIPRQHLFVGKMAEVATVIENILVVCVGNICRSPMAEALLRQALKDMSQVSVSSAGLGALVNHHAAEHAKALMSERGLDISGHRARQLTPDLIHESDLVLVMESGHKHAIYERYAAVRGKVLSALPMAEQRYTGSFPAAERSV